MATVTSMQRSSRPDRPHNVRLAGTCFVLLVLFARAPASAQHTGDCIPSSAEAYLEVNDVRARILNDGALFWDGSPHVYEVPKGGGRQSLFHAGLMIHAQIPGEHRREPLVAVARYNNREFWSGPIEADGGPPSSCEPFDRIFNISRDSLHAYHGGASPTSDLTDWPTGLGAPTLSEDGSIIDLGALPLAERVDRVIDLENGERPAIIGDQMLWWIMNDVGNFHNETETMPLGIEIHASAFSFDEVGPLRYTTFYRYRVLNRTPRRLDSLYFGFFVDPDVGHWSDDLIGADSVLGLAYTYNADNYDESGDRIGYGDAPPAIGFDFVRAPSADGSQTGMTSFVDYNLCDWVYCSVGALGFYLPQVARGRLASMTLREGNKGWDAPESAPQTTFMYSGDPVGRQFWTELNTDGLGATNEPGDRRFMASSGPNNMESGDVLEFEVAIIWARGKDHLDSVRELRRASRTVQAFVDSGYDRTVPFIDAPAVTAAPANGAAVLHWTNADTSNNAQNSFSEYAAVVDATYHFEGYDVYRFDSPNDTAGTRIATYDVANGVTTVLDGLEGGEIRNAAYGSDTGVRGEHVVGDLDNHRTYHFGIQAYAYQDGYYPKIIRSAMTRVSVEPRADATGATPGEVLGSVGIVPNPYLLASEYEISGGKEVRIVNIPDGSTGRIFTLAGTQVRAFTQEGTSSIHWYLTNEAGRTLSSGVYLIHVDVPDVGTQVVKFSVVDRGR